MIPLTSLARRVPLAEPPRIRPGSSKLLEQPTQSSVVPAAFALLAASLQKRTRTKRPLRVFCQCSAMLESTTEPWRWWGVDKDSWPGHLKELEDEAEDILHEFFGHDLLRPEQREVVRAAIQLKDVSVYWATGAGKSLCYQLFALLAWQRKGGVVVVIEPVIALMIDQVQNFNSAPGASSGCRACLLGSAQPDKSIVKAALEGQYALVYMTPECLTEHLLEGLRTLYQDGRLAMFSVDEAAYIHLWGHYFRPSFRNLWFAREEYPAVPFMTLSGAAPPALQRFIASELNLRIPLKSLRPMFRPNLHISCTRRESEKKDLDRIAELVSKPGSSSIVYVVVKAMARRVGRELRNRLQSLGIRVEVLTGDTPTGERADLNEAFKHDDIQVMVATSAYGMGIDKPSIDNVINYGPPKNLEDYCNQIGRAGRDGRSATCRLFLNNNDWKLFSESSTFTRELREMHKDDRQLEVDSREKMQRLATSNCCRWKSLLAHFGCEEEIPSAGCGTCDVCRKEIDLRTERLQTFTLPSHLLLEATRMATVPDAAPSKEAVLQMALATTATVESSGAAGIAHLEVIRTKLKKHELSKLYLSALLDALYGHGLVRREYVATDDFNDDAFGFILTETGAEALRSRQAIQLMPSRDLRNRTLPELWRDRLPSRPPKKDISEALEELAAVDCDDDEAKAAAAKRLQEVAKQLTSIHGSQQDLLFTQLLDALTIRLGRQASMEDFRVQYEQDSDNFHSCSIVVVSLASVRFTGVSLEKSFAIEMVVKNIVEYLGRKKQSRKSKWVQSVNKLLDAYGDQGLEIKTTCFEDNTFLCEVEVHSFFCETFKGRRSSLLSKARTSALNRARSSRGSAGENLKRLLDILTLRLGKTATSADFQYLPRNLRGSTYAFDLYIPAVQKTFKGGRCNCKSNARRSCLKRAIASLSGTKPLSLKSEKVALLKFVMDSLGRVATEDDVEISYVQLPGRSYTCNIGIPALYGRKISGRPCANKGLATKAVLEKARVELPSILKTARPIQVETEAV